MRFFRWFWIATGLYLMTGCYEPKEGCLDHTATNYDVSADRNCCCNYPGLHLNFGLNWQDHPFFEDSVYYLKDSVPFKLLEMHFLMSDVTLKREGKAIFSDSMAVFETRSRGELQLPDDFGWLSLPHRSVVIPDFIVLEQYDTLCLRLGLKYPDISPELLDNEHPLYPTNSGWSPERGFPLLSMKWLTGITLEDTVAVNYYSSTPPTSILLCFPRDIEGMLGSTTEIELELYLDEWLEGIDPTHPDGALLFQKLPEVLR